MVFDGNANEFGPGTFCHFYPLVRIQFDGVEHLGRQLRVCPVCLLERGKAEVDEHAEAKVHKLLLQLVQAFLLGAGRQRAGQEGQEDG